MQSCNGYGYNCIQVPPPPPPPLLPPVPTYITDKEAPTPSHSTVPARAWSRTPTRATIARTVQPEHTSLAPARAPQHFRHRPGHVAPRMLALTTLTRADAAHLSRAVAKSVAYTHERPAAAGTDRADERGRLLRARARTKGAARRAPMPKA